MTPEEKRALLQVAHWTIGKKRIVVKTIRQLAGSEEHYLLIIREIDRVKAQVQRARILGVEATLTLVEWLSTLDDFDWLCAYCRSNPFQVMSHIVPFPQGGTSVENCVPACHRCSCRCKADERERVQKLLMSFREQHKKGRGI